MNARASVHREGSEDFLWFWCAGCETNHRVPVTGARKWTWNGTLDAPTLQPSILVNAGRANPDAPLCHSFVTHGRIQYLADSTHLLAGQTIDLEPTP